MHNTNGSCILIILTLTYIDNIDIIKQTRTQSLEGYNEVAGYKEEWRRVKAWYPGKHHKMNRMNRMNGLYWDVHQSNLAIIGTGHWPTCIRLPIPCSVLIVGPRPGNFYDLGKSAEDRANCPATMPCGGSACGIQLLPPSTAWYRPRSGKPRLLETQTMMGPVWIEAPRECWIQLECHLDWTSVGTTVGHKARYAMTHIAMWTKLSKQWWILGNWSLGEATSRIERWLSPNQEWPLFTHKCRQSFEFYPQNVTSWNVACVLLSNLETRSNKLSKWRRVGWKLPNAIIKTTLLRKADSKRVLKMAGGNICPKDGNSSEQQSPMTRQGISVTDGWNSWRWTVLKGVERCWTPSSHVTTQGLVYGTGPFLKCKTCMQNADHF